MRLFACPACGGTLWFDNLACSCGAALAYDPGRAAFVTGAAPCANRETIACNWVAADGAGSLCRSCAMTVTVPGPRDDPGAPLWREAERAKRWALAGIARWGWFTAADPGPLPRFRLLVEDGRGVVTGHAGGVITIDLDEADAATRAWRRDSLGEALRTVVGHFRHEMGHFVFARLAGRDGFLGEVRAAMGDERAEYGAALARHYEVAPLRGWERTHVTPYAASHPSEDWAETFAHLLHLAAIADSARAAGLSVQHGEGWDAAAWDPYREPDCARLVERAGALGLALNHVNRAMGLEDIYPFVLPGAVRTKLALVHRWVSAGPG